MQIRMMEPPRVSLSLLGPAMVVSQKGEEVGLTNRKALALLAYLAVESAQPHSREALLGLLWPDLPEADARNNLRVTWSQLRGKLGDDNMLLSTRLEMQFNPNNAHWLDVAEFRQLLQTCAQHAHGHRSECAECQARLAQAVELYRGDFLAGFFLDGCAEFDEWLMVQRERFRQHMLALLNELAQYHERAGELKIAESHVRQLLQLDPLREDAHRQLMRLLQQQDQRAAALAQFEVCKRLLADELGVEPEPETLALAIRIRSGIVTLQSTPSNASAQRSQTHLHNLPTPLTRFFGREKELAVLAAQLTDPQCHLITLTGSGGVGKTRLALRAAYDAVPEFANGVWLVELATLSDPLSMAQAVAAALGVREQAGMPVDQLLCQMLQNKQVLLVMDNCEHVREASAGLITQLLAAAPRLHVLATSRTPLHLEREQVHRVPSLAVPQPERGMPSSQSSNHASINAPVNAPVNASSHGSIHSSINPSLNALTHYESVQLFINRAALAHPNFNLNAANASAVAHICRRLDGIPLALELAAARLKVMPVEALAQRLDNRFKLLTSGQPDTLPRHRTLQALVEWSYDLLSPAEKAVLRQLSVFVGGWILEAAEAICAGDAVDHIDGDSVDGGPADGASVLEHLMNLVDHSLVQFGHDTQQARYTLLESMRQFGSEQLKRAGESHATSARHARYYAQLVADAAAQANTPFHQAALTRIELEHDNVFAALNWAIQHDLDLAAKIGMGLGSPLQFWELRGHFEEGRRWLMRLLDAMQNQHTPARAQVLMDAASIEIARPDFARALALTQESARLFHELNDARGGLIARLTEVRIASFRGETAHSMALAQTCIEQGEQLGYPFVVARGLYELGTGYSDKKDRETARHLLGRSIDLWRRIGDKLRLAEALNFLASVLDTVDDDDGALALYEELETIHRELGYQRGLALVQNNMGCLLMKQKSYERAKTLFVEGLLIRRELGVQRGYLYSFLNFASLAACQHQPVRATRLFGAADALRERLGLIPGWSDLDGYDDTYQELRVALGETRYNLEWSRGRGMTADQAIELALSE